MEELKEGEVQFLQINANGYHTSKSLFGVLFSV
jgi:hypothetical protein